MNFDDLLVKMITRPDQIKLSTIEPLSTINDENFKTNVSNFLTHSQPNPQFMAIMLISAYQSNKLTFLFSYRIFLDLIKQANEIGLIKRKTLSGTDFKSFIIMLRQLNYVEVLVRGNKAYEASIVKIIDPDFKDLLVKKSGLEFFNAQEKRCIELHASVAKKGTSHPTSHPPLRVETSHDIVSSEVVSSDILSSEKLPEVHSGSIAPLPLRPPPVDQRLVTPVIQAEPANVSQNLPPNEWPGSEFHVSEEEKELVARFLRKRT